MAIDPAWTAEMSRRGARIVELVKIELDSSTTISLVSGEELTFGYSPAVVKITPFERSVDPFDRSHSTGDVSITLKKNALVRELLWQGFLPNKRIAWYLGTAGLVESAFEPIFRGRIRTFTGDSDEQITLEATDTLGALNRVSMTGKWPPIHPLEIMKSLYVDWARASTDEYYPDSFNPPAYADISHWKVIHGGGTQLLADAGIDQPRNCREVASELCGLMNGTLTTDPRGRDMFKRYNRNAGRVRHWGVDKISGFELIDAHAYHANRVTVRAFGGGGINSAMGILHGSAVVGGTLKVSDIDPISITMDSASAQIDAAAPGDVYKAIEKTLDTNGWVNGIDIVGISPNLVYSGNPNTETIPTNETSVTLVEPGLQGFCGAVPLNAPQWRKADGIRLTYLMMGQEIIACSSVLPGTLGNANFRDATAYYTEEYYARERDSIIRRYAGHLSPSDPLYQQYQDEIADLQHPHPFEFFFMRRGEFGTTIAPFVAITYDPTGTSADFPHGFPNYPNIIADVTIPVDMARTRLDRFAYGAAVVAFRLPLAEADIRLGDCVSFDRPSLICRGINGADQNVFWEVVGVRVESSSSEPHVRVTLCFMRQEQVGVWLWTPQSPQLTRFGASTNGTKWVPNKRGKFGETTLDGLDVTATSGRRVEVAPGRADSAHGSAVWPHKREITLPASSDNYIRVSRSTGAIIVESVNNGDAEPTLRTGWSRVAMAVTGASSVSSVTDQKNRRPFTAERIRWPLTEYVEIATGIVKNTRPELAASRTRIQQVPFTTTNNTQITAHSWTPRDNSCSRFAVLVSGYAGSDYAAFEISATVRRGTGTATVTNVVATSTDRSNAEISATVDASGNDVRVRVAGRTGVTMQWSVTVIENRGGA